MPPEDALSARRGRAEAETSPAERVMFFSDAVVAIAITLLAIDLPVPQTTNSTTNGQLLRELGSDWPAYLAFIISFYVIANHWSRHRRVFQHVQSVNSTVNSLMLAWLLMMILIPFSARLLASDGAFGVRFTIYALIQVIAVLCQLRASRELHRAGLLRPDAPKAGTQRDFMVDVIFIAAFLLSIPVSFATKWAFAVWAAAPLGARVLQAVRVFRTASST